MAGKRIIIELKEADCCDGCAVDEVIEKVQYQITTGLTSGSDPSWRIEDRIEPEQPANKKNQRTNKRRLALIDFYYRVGKNLDNDKDIILFIQCFNALAHKEGHKLSKIYQDDFNQAFMRNAEMPTILMADED